MAFNSVTFVVLSVFTPLAKLCSVKNYLLTYLQNVAQPGLKPVTC